MSEFIPRDDISRRSMSSSLSRMRSTEFNFEISYVRISVYDSRSLMWFYCWWRSFYCIARFEDSFRDSSSSERRRRDCSVSYWTYESRSRTRDFTASAWRTCLRSESRSSAREFNCRSRSDIVKDYASSFRCDSFMLD